MANRDPAWIDLWEWIEAGFPFPVAMTTLQNLQQATGGDLIAATDTRVKPHATRLGRVVTDSRRVEPGDIFWALAGEKHDGADFVDEAFDRLAAGVVTSTPVPVPYGRWNLVVRHTQTALWDWARWNRSRFTGTVIAVTGSVGKTTARQMIHAVLSKRLTGTASPGNFNNHLGVPLSMLQIDPTHDYAVLELGANRPGEIRALAELCKPTIGVITAIGDAHLGGFGSRRAIAREKTELLATLPRDGLAVLADDPWLRNTVSHCKTTTHFVGAETNQESTVRLDSDVATHGGVRPDVEAKNVRWRDGRLTFTVRGCPVVVNVWGRHHLTSALAAVAVGLSLKFEIEEIAEALANFAPVDMRCEVTEIRGATVINDAYNASPMAMRAALELLRDCDAPGRRIVVCGDMGELGQEAVGLHRELGKQIIAIGRAELLIACGQFAREVVGGARSVGMNKSRSVACHTVQQSLPYLDQAVLPGDVVLVKGARVMAMERVIEAMRRYPERRGA